MEDRLVLDIGYLENQEVKKSGIPKDERWRIRESKFRNFWMKKSTVEEVKESKVEEVKNSNVEFKKSEQIKKREYIHNEIRRRYRHKYCSKLM